MKWMVSGFILAILASSCSVKQEFYFNTNMSGDAYTEVDISALKALSDMDDSASASEFDTMNLDEWANSLKTIPGISNVSSNNEEGLLSMKYHFNNLTALNASQSGDESKSAESLNRLMTFESKGKTLKFRFSKMDELGYDDEGADEEYEMMQMMSASMTYELVLRFEKTVKKVSNFDYKISFDRHSVTMNCDLADLMSGDRDFDVDIKLK